MVKKAEILVYIKDKAFHTLKRKYKIRKYKCFKISKKMMLIINNKTF